MSKAPLKAAFCKRKKLSVTCSGSLKATVAKHVKHVAIKSWGGFGDGVHLMYEIEHGQGDGKNHHNVFGLPFCG